MVEFLKWCKENKNIPFILMTAYSDLVEARSASKLGADGFLSKPFRDEELSTLIEQLLSGQVESIQNDFFKLPIDSFVDSETMSMDVFISISEGKFIRISNKGEVISRDLISSYRSQNIQAIYVLKRELAKELELKSDLSAEVKTAKELDGILTYVANSFSQRNILNIIGSSNTQEYNELLITFLRILACYPFYFNYLAKQFQNNQMSFDYSLNMSLLSILVAKASGWHSIKMYSNIIFSCLLSKSDLMKNSAQSDIFLELPTLTQDILLEYQEFCDGSGKPNGLTKKEIHPLARLNCISNTFMKYFRENVDLGSPVDVIDFLAGSYEEKLDKALLTVLAKQVRKEDILE